MKKIINNFSLPENIMQLFDATAGMLFFIKGIDCRLITGNKLLLLHLGFERKEDILGKSDFDIFPIVYAERYYEDDLEIISKQQSKSNIVELFPNHLGELDWFVTTKIPLFDHAGNIAGLCGVLQSYNNSNHYSIALKEIAKALDYIKDNYTQKLSNSHLAELCGLSVRQFENRFKDIFQSTPHQYIIKMKILKACELIVNGEMAINEIGLFLGFYDQSAFTAQFKKNVGHTPSQYIKQRNLQNHQ
ncbi:helix-turn-helix domain-containing protein [Paraglaciecola sp. L3A3]|uniref:helix-turn-helix domain-containing protein n=1 Tax=Paraglaciecola sp. L3A3 TaxID=2686358 RepID=UPI00131E650B|nr:helix-turn-helix domain-containing protein [Paraglaciecola sp. L3A3]